MTEFEQSRSTKTKVQDSSGAIINPATEGTLSAIKDSVAVLQNPVFKTGTASGTGVFIAAFEVGSEGYFSITGTTSGAWVNSTTGLSGLVAVEGTNDTTGSTGWSAIRMENPNGGSTTAMRAGGTYATKIDYRWLRVNCLVYQAGSMAVNLVVFPQPRALFRQNIKDVDGIASVEVTPGTGLMHTTPRAFLVGGNFDVGPIDTSVWTVTTTGSASATYVSGSGIKLATGTTANSTVKIEGVRKANLLAGASNVADILAATEAGAVAGCVKRWGVFDDTSGVFFEQFHDGTASRLQLKTRKGGVDTSGGALNGANNIGDNAFGVPVFNLYELQIDPLFVKAKQNGVLIHLFNGLFPTLFSKYDLPFRFEVINSGGTASNNTLYVQNAGAYRLGLPETVRADQVFKAQDVLAASSAVIQGQKPDGTFAQVGLDKDASIQVSAQQITDSGNSITITSASSLGQTPGNPWTGTPFATRSRNIQENLTTIAAFNNSGNLSNLGGTFTFKYHPDSGGSPGTAIITEILTIRSFSTVRNVGWLSNAGDYYSVKFEPSRTLVSGETVAITTIHSKLAGNDFKRQPTQVLEQENQSLTTIQAFIKGFKQNGDSENVRLTTQGDLRIGQQAVISAEGFNSSNVPLLAGQTFTGQWEYCADYASLELLLNTDVLPDIDGVIVQFSKDGTLVDKPVPIDFVQGTNGNYAALPTEGSYCRVLVVNSTGSNQTRMRLQTTFSYLPSGPRMTPINDTVTDAAAAQLVRSVLTGQQPDGDYENVRVSGSVPTNTTSTLLSANGVYTGTAYDTTGFVSVTVSLIASHASASNGLRIEFSNDSFVTIHKLHTFTYPASLVNTGLMFTVAANQGEEFRVKYTNGTTNQTLFSLRTELTTDVQQTTILPLSSTLDATTAAQVVRGVLAGTSPSGTILNVPTDTQGRLQTTAGSDFARLLQRIVENTDELRLDVEPTNADFYIGKAGDGTATSAASWDVIRIYLSTSKNPTRIRFRQGVVWDNRTSGWT